MFFLNFLNNFNNIVFNFCIDVLVLFFRLFILLCKVCELFFIDIIVVLNELLNIFNILDNFNDFVFSFFNDVLVWLSRLFVLFYNVCELFWIDIIVLLNELLNVLSELVSVLLIWLLFEKKEMVIFNKINMYLN